MTPIRVGIVGASGYTGAELLRLLIAHPHCEILAITSRQYAGQALSQLFRNLPEQELSFSDPEAVDFSSCDLVFFATPHGVAMNEAPKLLAQGVRVLDFSGDFRLSCAEDFLRWYGRTHTAPELLSQAVYGLPELFRAALPRATLVANPGCYATAVQLGLAPLLKAGLVKAEACIADVKSGVSGAGRTAKLGQLFAECAENFHAYALEGHRHQPEIERHLRAFSGQDVRCTFVPHLLPMIRGIEATLYAPLKEVLSRAVLWQHVADFYRDEPFVRVLPLGLAPETQHVRASNFVHIGVELAQGGTLAVLSVVEDNLVKGAAGQAVQAMNAMFSLPESCGLTAVAPYP